MSDAEFYDNLANQRTVDMSYVTGRFGTEFNPNQFVTTILSYLTETNTTTLPLQRNIGIEIVDNFWQHTCDIISNYQPKKLTIDDSVSIELMEHLTTNNLKTGSKILYYRNQNNSRKFKITANELLVRSTNGSNLNDIVNDYCYTKSNKTEVTLLVISLDKPHESNFITSSHVNPQISLIYKGQREPWIGVIIRGDQ